jgi:hypothetical protein
MPCISSCLCIQSASLTSGLWSFSGLLPPLSGSWIHSKCLPSCTGTSRPLGPTPLLFPDIFLFSPQCDAESDLDERVSGART